MARWSCRYRKEIQLLCVLSFSHIAVIIIICCQGKGSILFSLEEHRSQELTNSVFEDKQTGFDTMQDCALLYAPLVFPSNGSKCIYLHCSSEFLLTFLFSDLLFSFTCTQCRVECISEKREVFHVRLNRFFLLTSKMNKKAQDIKRLKKQKHRLNTQGYIR